MKHAILFAALLAMAPLTTEAAQTNTMQSIAPLATKVPASGAYGRISSEALLAHYPDFAGEYARYTPSADALAQMQSLEGLKVVVLFASWCHDSEREVPRLLKLLKQSGVALSALQLEAVNQQKQHPEQLHNKYSLRYTSTIIVLDSNDQELGRIIEKPKQSLAEDLAAIAAHR
jgi:thiol-disulfide isomerase/thioredoxin